MEPVSLNRTTHACVMSLEMRSLYKDYKYDEEYAMIRVHAWVHASF